VDKPQPKIQRKQNITMTNMVKIKIVVYIDKVRLQLKMYYC